MRQKVGAVAAFKQVVVVPKLPKTRSGKVARSTLVAMAAGKPFQVSRGFVTLFSDTLWLDQKPVFFLLLDYLVFFYSEYFMLRCRRRVLQWISVLGVLE